MTFEHVSIMTHQYVLLLKSRYIGCRSHTEKVSAEHVKGGGKEWDTVKPLHKWFKHMHRVLLMDDDAYKVSTLPHLGCDCMSERKEKTAPFGVNLMRSQVLYRAAQVCMSAYLNCAAPATVDNDNKGFFDDFCTICCRLARHSG